MLSNLVGQTFKKDHNYLSNFTDSISKVKSELKKQAERDKNNIREPKEISKPFAKPIPYAPVSKKDQIVSD